jgi:hypothetical protein
MNQNFTFLHSISKKQRFACSSLVLFIVFFSLSFSVVYGQTLRTGQMPRVEVAKATGSNLMQFPVAVSMDYKETNNEIVKKIILGWANTTDTPNAPINNQWKSSWDGGATYSGTITTVPSLNLNSVIRLRNGSMVSVPFDAARSTNPSSTVCTFNYLTSANNGGNWSAQTGGTVTFPVQTYWMRFHRGIFQENDGTCYAPAYVSYAVSGGATRSVLLKSTDNGKTWTLHSEITNPVTHGKAFDETVVSRCANGNWIAVMRQQFPTASNYQPLMYSRSTDQGIHWTAPAYLPGLGNAHTAGDDLNESSDPDLLLMSNGVLVLSYGRPNVHLAFSPDGNGTNWTNVQTTFTETPGTLGAEATGYTAIVPVTGHRFIQFGDTGANWNYPANPSPNPFSIWSRYIDIVRPQRNRIDLKRRLSYGVVTVMPATTLTYTDAAHPESRLSAPFDGSVDYWSGALGTNSGVFQIDLKATYNINSIGLALLPGKEQSATVQYSLDGSTWSPSGVNYVDTVQYAINYTDVTPFSARYIRVNVSGSGQIGLSELELYEASSTFENDAASGPAAINGLVPAGYQPNGTSSTLYGFSVQDGQGCASNRALKLIDNSGSYRAGIKKIVSSSNKKTLEFLCRAATVPSTGSFNFQIIGTVAGVESTVFYIAVFGDGKIKANNGSGWTQVGTATFPINTGNWRRIKIAANESANIASIYVDTVLVGTTAMYSDPVQTTTLTGFGFGSNGTPTSGEIVYFDDVNFYDPTVSPPSGISATENKKLLADLVVAPAIEKFKVTAAPNPTTGNIVLNLTGANDGPADFIVTSILGASSKTRYVLSKGFNKITLPADQLAPGVYLVTVKQAGQVSTVKIILN